MGELRPNGVLSRTCGDNKILSIVKWVRRRSDFGDKLATFESQPDFYYAQSTGFDMTGQPRGDCPYDVSHNFNKLV